MTVAVAPEDLAQALDFRSHGDPRILLELLQVGGGAAGEGFVDDPGGGVADARYLVEPAGGRQGRPSRSGSIVASERAARRNARTRYVGAPDRSSANAIFRNA